MNSTTQGSVQEGQEYLWPNATADVCWERMNDPEFAQYTSMRSKIAALTTSEFARAGFTLTGRNACGPDTRGIRILQQHYSETEPSDGFTKAFGRRIDGVYEGVHITMGNPKSADAEMVALGIALHEMGHAIGMTHEANRHDSLCHFDQSSGFGDEFRGILPVGQYDPDSIMNYCAGANRRLKGLMPRLSDGDISTIRKYYSGDTVFPRQMACQNDGHSWASEDAFSCCRKSPSGQMRPDARLA